MRIWDVHPGYLARQQLLGEHRELHGMFNILSQGKKGYSKHPETLRWAGHLPALVMRHRQLVSEMTLRGYNHLSPLPDTEDPVVWPDYYLDAPGRQLRILAEKYASDQRSGRIPLPRNSQQLWAQHKYSVMAIDPALYRQIGPEVAHGCYRDDHDGLARMLVTVLRQPVQRGRLLNALLHMWGYVKDEQGLPEGRQLVDAIRHCAVLQQSEYLLHSTALCDIAVWF